VEDKLHKQHFLEASAEFQLILTLWIPDFFPWTNHSRSKNIIIHECLLLFTVNSIKPLKQITIGVFDQQQDGYWAAVLIIFC